MYKTVKRDRKQTERKRQTTNSVRKQNTMNEAKYDE